MEPNLILNLIHRELIAELAWPMESYPVEIQGKMQAIDQMEAQYTAAPTLEEKTKIEKASGKLWHDIKDLEEKDRPDEHIGADLPKEDTDTGGSEVGRRSIARRHTTRP